MNKIINFQVVVILFILFFQFSFPCCSFAAQDIEEKQKVKIERHFVFDTIPLDLEEIVSSSDRIFTGRCINVKEIENDIDSRNLPVVKFTFKVIEGLKGTKSKKEITFKQWQPTIRNANYQIGKKYVLFLYPDSEFGLTSPVGFLQGQFEIEEKGIVIKKEVVKNKLGNKGLNRNLKTQKVINIKEDKYINDYLHRCSELGIAMRYKEFVKAVNYLVKREK